MNAPDESVGLSLEIDGDRIGNLIFDLPGSKVNLLSSDVLRRLDALLSELESRIANGQLTALVLRSGKEGTFIAGADVREIAALRSAAEARAASAEGQRIFRRLHRLRVPTIAAVDGACVGGGAELALHCDWILASERDSTKIGLPEVQLGILPGFGGTVRLPERVGLQRAMELILTGRTVDARRARRYGLVDRTAAPGRWETAISELVADVLDGRAVHAEPRRSTGTRLLEGTPPGRRILFWMARRRARQRSGGHYPAPLRALDVLERAHGEPPDRAYALEADALGELAVTDVARNLVRLFLLRQEARHAVPAERLEARPPVRRAAVIGAGVMGGSIAELIASIDVPVLLKDIDREALDSGLRHASSLLRKAARKGVFAEREATRKFALIEGTLEYRGFPEVDVAIEAVVERMPVKQQVVRDLEEHLGERAVIASNTSALSIAELASAAGRPERVLGLHFFNPVHKMPLVEVVRPEGASPEAVAAAFGFVLDLGKTPVITADRTGFLVNRLLGPYLNEAGYLLEEGAGVERIDAALEEFGMPMGPCRLLDEIGFDIAAHAAEELEAAFGARMAPSPVVRRLQEDGRLGRKNGRGFYLHEEGEDPRVDPQVAAAYPESASGPGPEEIRRRCLLPLVNEAARALEEEVVEGPEQVDLAMVLGTGFPPFRGGPLRWADGVGPAAVVARLRELEEGGGARFAPAPLLVGLAERGGSFTGPA